MSDFLDFDALEQDSKDANIIPHPLRDKLSESAKASYIRMIVFAGLADDETLSAIELEYGRTRALSLGLNADEFDEAVNTVRSLGGQQERMKFLREMLTAFTDRTVSMYVLCDMAQAMASDGELTENASKFLDSLYRLLLKSENKPDNPLSPTDQKFLTDYRPFLAPGKTADASEVIHDYQVKEFAFPDGLVKFFSSNMKPIVLPGGEYSGHRLLICSGKFALNEELIVPVGTDLVLEDAEIVFGPKGRLTLKGTQYEFLRCEFTVNGGLAKQGMREFVLCDEGVLSVKIDTCEFNGKHLRTAIVARVADVVVLNSQFIDLRGVVDGGYDQVSDSCISCKKILCESSIFSGFFGRYILGASDMDLKKCSFIGCKSTSDFLYYHGYDNTFYGDLLMFDGCSSPFNVVGAVRTKSCGSFSFNRYCFVNCQYKKITEVWRCLGGYSCDEKGMTPDEFERAMNE